MARRNVVKLYEAAYATLLCDYCSNKITAEDAVDVAALADDLGWTVNKSDKVKCESCTEKLKKYSTTKNLQHVTKRRNRLPKKR